MVNQKKVVCLNNKKIYVSQIAAARDNNIKCPGQIGMAADGIRQFSGKDKNGIPLLWVRYEEFVNMNNEEIEERLSKTVKRTSEHSVICLNTMRVFNSVFDASNYCGGYTSGIIRCAQSWFGKQTGHIRKHCGRDPQTGELLSWIYKDDFDKLSDEKKMVIIDSYKKR